MKAVILAAGKGKRMLPLTNDVPKPMLKVLDKPILQRIIDSLPLEITEIIIVTGYLGEQIKEHFGELYEGRQITYVTQAEANGTFAAILAVRNEVSEKFLLLNADDLHGTAALAEAIKHPLALIVSRHEDPTKFGVVTKNEDGTLRDFIEKPETFTDNLVSTGGMVLDERIFSYSVSPASNGELYITPAIQQLAKDYPVQVIEQPEWIAIGYPEDLTTAEEILKAKEHVAEQEREETREEKKEESKS